MDTSVLNETNVSGIPPHVLPLKVGACIILIRSLHPKKGFCNGTRCIIVSIHDNIIEAERLYDKEAPHILIPHVPMVCKETSKTIVPFRQRQYPILLAYYMTYNRAQGQSLDTVGLLLPHPAFSHGQLYVGHSCCGDPNKGYVYADQDHYEHLHEHLQDGKQYNKNIVWPKVLSCSP